MILLQYVLLFELVMIQELLVLSSCCNFCFSSVIVIVVVVIVVVFVICEHVQGILGHIMLLVNTHIKELQRTTSVNVFSKIRTVV